MSSGTSRPIGTPPTGPMGGGGGPDGGGGGGGDGGWLDIAAHGNSRGAFRGRWSRRQPPIGGRSGDLEVDGDLRVDDVAVDGDGGEVEQLRGLADARAAELGDHRRPRQ